MKKSEILNFLNIIEPLCVIKGPQVNVAKYFMLLPRLPSHPINADVNKKEGMLRQREDLYLLMKDLKDNPTRGRKRGNLQPRT